MRLPYTATGAMHTGKRTSDMRVNFQSSASSAQTPPTTQTGCLMRSVLMKDKAVCAMRVSFATRLMRWPDWLCAKNPSDCAVMCSKTFRRMSASTRRLTQADR